jgi:hypothetical protein
VTEAKLLFEHERALVFCGRWQDIGLTDDSLDVVLSDPPYTGHVHGNVRSCATAGPVRVKTFDVPFDPLTSYEHVPELLRITKRWVVLFCALEQLGDYRAAAGGDRARLKDSDGKFLETTQEYRARLAGFVRSGIWRKQQTAPQLTGDRPANSCEGWAVMHRRGGAMHWNGNGKHAYLTCADGDQDVPAYCAPDFIEAGRERAEKRHAAQKPTAVCDRLAGWFVDAGDIVGDLWCGSGALGMAALRRGAIVIFADIDPEWAQFTADRVAAELTTGTIDK